MTSVQMETRRALAARAAAYLREGYHCSEAVVLAVAPSVVRDWHPACCRTATGFAGGVGGTHQELCGALSGCVMVIGALFGRLEVDDDTLCQRLVKDLHTRFRDTFGGTQCAWLREHVVDAEGGLGSCEILVERATMILLDVLAAAGVQLQGPPGPEGADADVSAD